MSSNDGMSLYDLMSAKESDKKTSKDKAVQKAPAEKAQKPVVNVVQSEPKQVEPTKQVDTEPVSNKSVAIPKQTTQKSQRVVKSPIKAQTKEDSQALADDYHTPFDFVSQMLTRDDVKTDEVSLSKELSKSTSGKIPTLLWDEARTTWINLLGYAGKSTKIKSFNNTSLVAGLLIRSLNMEQEQRDSLIRAFPHADIIHDIVYYKDDGNVGSISSSLVDLKHDVAQLQQSVDNHDSHSRRLLGAIKRVVSWLFLERVGYSVGTITSKGSLNDATAELLDDYTTKMSSELDVIGDAEVKRERTTRKSRRI